MSHGTEHHLEEAEHAKHAKHHPFDRRVAMTMAIVAASLACVTLLSHRAHTEYTASLIAASNQWNYYQAKKNRGYMLDAEADLLIAEKEGQPGADSLAAKQAAQWKKRAEDYAEEANGIAKDAKDLEEQGHAAHRRSNFFDAGELGLEIALVLCSVAVLSKQTWFWYSGIAVSVAGALVAVCGYFVVH
jgi:hypothetical protein